MSVMPSTILRVCRLVAIALGLVAPFYLSPLIVSYVVVLVAIGVVEVVASLLERSVWRTHDYVRRPSVHQRTLLLWIDAATGIVLQDFGLVQLLVGVSATLAWRFCPAPLRRPLAAVIALAYAGLLVWIALDVTRRSMLVTAGYGVLFLATIVAFAIFVVRGDSDDGQPAGESAR